MLASLGGLGCIALDRQVGWPGHAMSAVAGDQHPGAAEPGRGHGACHGAHAWSYAGRLACFDAASGQIAELRPEASRTPVAAFG